MAIGDGPIAFISRRIRSQYRVAACEDARLGVKEGRSLPHCIWLLTINNA